MTGRRRSHLEVVARAICTAAGVDPDQPVYREGNPQKGVLYRKWKIYRVEALAAIRASKVEKMAELLKRLDQAHLGDRTFDEEAVYEVWREARNLRKKMGGSE